MRKFVISEQDLKDLIYDSLLLQKLQHDGVDNWHLYSVPEELEEQTQDELEGYVEYGS